jgi:hypothetical protein
MCNKGYIYIYIYIYIERETLYPSMNSYTEAFTPSLYPFLPPSLLSPSPSSSLPSTGLGNRRRSITVREGGGGGAEEVWKVGR